ncbi:hypothetical protein N7454_010938 [Penicillium verhagenii]|nr:hypothetical protein N7454_010938 [Penicillium verhagenii]
MGTQMEAAPVLSTPDDRMFELAESVAPAQSQQVSDAELSITYDIERTLKEIRQARYKRIALQFPDDMLPDAPRVFQLLSRGLNSEEIAGASGTNAGQSNGQADTAGNITEGVSQLSVDEKEIWSPRLYILADTSYGTCCVDEVAAEHVEADVAVHYGRSCLSPTARLPVIYVFTNKALSIDPVVEAFKATYTDPTTHVIIAADVTYAGHIPEVYKRLVDDGYTNLFATEVIHEPSSAIPNRSVPESVREAPDTLSDWQLFHISDPPTALLLTLASRVAAIHIYPTNNPGNGPVKPLPASTGALLSRRYALTTRLTTVPIWGILINTLSVKNYLGIVDHVKEKIAAAVANFSEIGGWVVIGCWESSLVDSKEFFTPVITPFELELALKSDDERVWTGSWQSNFQTILDKPNGELDEADQTSNGETMDDEDDMSEPESAPPEFDLRTGRYVSHSRPMRDPAPRASAAIDGSSGPSAARALARRAKGDLAMIGGAVSPGAEFLRSQRTWKGLGSDFDIRYDDEESDSTLVKEGRKGIARGYTVGESEQKH